MVRNWRIPEKLIARIILSTLAGVVFIFSQPFPLQPPLRLETPQILLVIIGILPWLSDFIESITVGGNTIRLRVEENTRNIEYIIQLMRYVLTARQLQLLQNIGKSEEVRVGVPAQISPSVYYDGFKNDVLRLRGLHLIQNKVLPGGGGGFSELEKHGAGERNATEYFEITGEGRAFLETLQKLNTSK